MGIPEPYWVRLPHILTGNDAVSELGSIVRGLGAKRVAVITDAGVVKAGIINRVKEPLSREKIEFGVFDGCQPNAPVDTISSCATFVRQGGYDLLIGVGGGSVLDTTRLVAIAAKAADTEKEITEYAVNGFPRRGLPKILIPTTAGTGSEASHAAVLTDAAGMVRTMRGEYGVAEVAIVDPLLMLNLPPRITAETGMDAFCHAFEAYSSPRSNILSEALDEMAIKLIAKNLRPAYFNGTENLEARYSMAVAATYAMASIPMCGAILPHALSHAIQSEVKVAHGASLAAILIPIMEFNLSVCTDKYARIAGFMGEMVEVLSVKEAAFRAIDAVRKLTSDIELPQRLRDIGVEKGRIPHIVDILFTLNMRNVRNNPRPVLREDAVKILEAAW